MATDTVLEELVINDLTNPINPDDLPTTKEPNQLYLDDDTSLEKVVHDATLSGDGTEDSPLSVVGGGGGGSGLPDQTGHTGFLQTNGTEASWSDKDALVNNGITNALAVGDGSVANTTYSLTNLGTSAVAIGNGAEAVANGMIAIGGNAKAYGSRSIQIGPGTNNLANSLQIRSTLVMNLFTGKLYASVLANNPVAGKILGYTEGGMEWIDAPSGGGSDNNGLEGDYSTTYGIVDETTSGLPYIKAVGSRVVVVPAPLQVDMPGVPGLTTLTSDIEYEVQNTNNPQLFLLDTPINGSRIIESTDVFFSETEPDNGTSTFAVWWDGSGVFKLKSNDTGNVWRAANAVRIAKTVFTDGSLTRLCFTGCRVLNKQEFATKQQLSTGLSGKATKSTDFMTAVTSTNKGATKVEIDDINNSISTINTNISSIDTNIDSLYEELGEKLDTTVAASTYVTNTDAVHKTGDETIDGVKSFVKNIDLVLDTSNGNSLLPGSSAINFKDSNDNTRIKLESVYVADSEAGYAEMSIGVTGTSGSSASMGLRLNNSTGAATAYAPTPSADSKGTAIATTEWAHGHGILVASQMPTAANNWTWYRKYSDGWVEQGGYIGAVATNSAKTFTFPIPYKGLHDYIIVATGVRAGVAWGGVGSRTGEYCTIVSTASTENYIDVYTCGLAA